MRPGVRHRASPKRFASVRGPVRGGISTPLPCNRAPRRRRPGILPRCSKPPPRHAAVGAADQFLRRWPGRVRGRPACRGKARPRLRAGGECAAGRIAGSLSAPPASPPCGATEPTAARHPGGGSAAPAPRRSLGRRLRGRRGGPNCAGKPPTLRPRGVRREFRTPPDRETRRIASTAPRRPQTAGRRVSGGLGK